jgi:hypothetical protein
MGIVERIEYYGKFLYQDVNLSDIFAPIRTFLSFLIKRVILSITLVFITKFLWDWGLTWVAVAPLLGLVEWIDWLLSSMDPLPVGGGGSDAGPSRRPELDLNQPPAPEPEQQPNPYIELRKRQIKEEVKKNVKRLRFFQGMLYYWEKEMEISLQKERESAERKRLHLQRMQELVRNLWNKRR